MSKDITNRDLTFKQKKEFIKNITRLDSAGIELCYVLIRIYDLEHEEQSSTFKLPYDGKYINSTDINFNLEELPPRLKQILYKFVQIHIHKMNEEQDRIPL